MNKTEEVETFKFTAEIQSLMTLLISLIYQSREIFIRELLSNCFDAISKGRNDDLMNARESPEPYKIRIIPDGVNKTLTFFDTGVGMSREELISRLGTIASSGTRSFIEATKNGADAELIGQFGIGFYSAFIVSNTVTVISKPYGSKVAYQWESSAAGTYTISEYGGVDFVRGTKVILHIKDDQKEYLTVPRIKEVVKKHSEFLNVDIELLVTKEVTKKVPKELPTIQNDKSEEAKDVDADGESGETEESEKMADDDVKVEEVVDDDSSEKKEEEFDEIKETVEEFEVINATKPIWSLNPDQVTHEEYANFYKYFAGDWEEHLAVSHFNVEGQLCFNAVIFFPKRASYDLFEYRKKRSNVKLYVRNVFINDDCEKLIPDYLNFIFAVVDSEDLPLNISRETLQQNKILNVLKAQLTKRSIQLMIKLQDEEPEKYKEFYKQFSKNVKLGIHEDSANRSKLTNLLMYPTSKTEPNELITFKTYVERMDEGQDKIYYITGESIESVANSPFIESMNKNSFEVIYMVEPIDEYSISQITEFEGKKLVNVCKENLDFSHSEAEKAEYDNFATEYAGVCEAMKQVLTNEVDRVVICRRETTAPCYIVTSELGWSANMERIMKAQALKDNLIDGYMVSKKILEINPRHNIIKSLLANVDVITSKYSTIVELIYRVALVQSGFVINDTKSFSDTLFGLVSAGLSNFSNFENESLSKSNVISGESSRADSKKVQGETEVEDLAEEIL